MDPYGYEDILLQLARNGVKIQLSGYQSALLRWTDPALLELFQFNGKPDFKVWTRTGDEKFVRTAERYKKYVLCHSIIL